MNESLKKLKKSIELGSGKKGSYYVDKVGFDTNGNWSYMVSRGSNKAKKIQHQGDWGTKITKDSDWKEVENSKVAQNIINYYEKFVKESVNETISQSEKYKVYNTLKKGDEVEMDRRDGFKTYVVTKGKTILGKQKVERISLVLKDKPRAVKYYLYNRNKNIGLAIGDGASPLIDIRKSNVFIDGIEIIKKDGNKSFYPVHPSNLLITAIVIDDKTRLKSRAKPIKKEVKKETKTKEVKKPKTKKTGDKNNG